MKVGVDATSWFNPRGYGRFTRELLPELVAAGPEHEFVLLVEDQNADRLEIAGSNVRVRRIPCDAAPSEAAAADGYRSPRDMLRFTAAVRDERTDIFFFPTVYSFFPLPRGRRAVVTIHDTIAERYPELTLPSRRARLFWRLKVWLALKQSELVLTVSDYSARDISERLGVAPGKLRITTEAPAEAYSQEVSDEDMARAAELVGLPRGARWFTYVGGFNPHKRIDALLRAHARLAAELDDPPHLLLVGSLNGDVFHGCRDELVELVERLGIGSLVKWTGFVEDEELRALHAASLACVLPSECEGFGLPAVEAAACGAPVIATEESPLPDLLDGGGVFVPPGDEEALLDALRQLTADEAGRRAMGRRALECARNLSWSRAARIVLAALEEAVA